MARLQVRTFARYAEVLGDPIELDLPLPATVEELLIALRDHPGGDRLPARPLLAINHAIAGGEARITAGDVVALLPPLAGG